MSTTEAQLAHLRIVFGDRWRIQTSEPRQDSTRVYIASERSTGRKIVTQSLAELEERLARTTWPGREQPGG